MKTSPYQMLATILIFVSLPVVGQKAQAVVPAPDGCYPNFTTAEGCNALNLLTTGAGNTGLGWRSLFSDSTGNFNTGVGAGALILNNADANTAVGAAALLLNTTGTRNIAVGAGTLVFNDTGSNNTAVGAFALNNNDTGDTNTAIGSTALVNNVDGVSNTAVGAGALSLNVSGSTNTAIGIAALNNNLGNSNVGVGNGALFSNSNGDHNTALGILAGDNVTTAHDVICIGANVGGENVNNSCYIGSIFGQPSAGGAAVLINSNGKLGTTMSSRRFKEEIKPMAQSSEMIFAFNPVTFRYKKELDPQGSSQFGLVAEEVEKVNPDLVVRDKEGKVYSVRYDAVNAMLLNEFLKEHTAFLEEQRKVQRLEAALDTVNQRLKEQEAKIEKVSAQLEVSRSERRVVQTQ